MPRPKPQSMIGPMKGVGPAKEKTVKPAWTGMIKPMESEVSPSKIAFSALNAEFEDNGYERIGKSTSLSESQPNVLVSSAEFRHSLSASLSNKGSHISNAMNGSNMARTIKDENDLFKNYGRQLQHQQVFGPMEPQITGDFEAHVISGQFVDFSQLAILLGHASATEQATELLKRDILVWCDCFSLLVSIIARVHPVQIGSLMHYCRIILWIYRESHDPSAWWRYDKAFRRSASVTGNSNWSLVNQDMYAGAISLKYREALKCQDCLTKDHSGEKCPFMSMQKKRSSGSASVVSPVKVDHTVSPRRNERLEQALSNPEKTAQRPVEGLKLQFAFGYHGYNACNNVFYTQSNEVVFHAAAVGVVYNPKTHQQRFYFGHDDDILCLTVHDDQDVIATGQIGKSPSTHIWDISSLKSVAVLKGFHKRGVICVDFNGDGTKLADVGLDDDHSICVWDWKKQEMLASTRGHKDIIYCLEWNPYGVNNFVTVGVKHIKFWSINESQIVKRTATFGKAGELSDMLCICHSPREDLCFTGAASGEIYVWQGSTFRKSIPAHKGPVYAMFSILQSEEKGFVTGGNDGVVMIWDEAFTQPLRAFKVESSHFPPGTILLNDCPAVRSIHSDEGKVLVGTGNCEIIQIFHDGTMEMIVQGHGEGELWGLACHPFQLECATVSDDKTLRIWDLVAHQLKKVAVLKKGGRCLDYHPTGDTIAVGLNDGSFMIVDARSLKTLVLTKDRAEEISDIKFSPDGTYLGVASHDNLLDIYNVKKGRKRAVCRGSSSYITHIDWNSEGRLVQTNSGAREHLIFEIPSGTRKTMGTDVIMRTDWSTFTSVIGPCVKGIYPPMTDVTDVNAACRTKDYKLIASGDDFGLVKVFQFPILLRGAKYRSYKGHCCHVTNVRWTFDDKFLLSTGGMDGTLLLWERIPVSRDVEEENDDSSDKLVQPKFKPTGPIKDPVAKGRPVWD